MTLCLSQITLKFTRPLTQPSSVTSLGRALLWSTMGSGLMVTFLCGWHWNMIPGSETLETWFTTSSQTLILKPNLTMHHCKNIQQMGYIDFRISYWVIGVGSKLFLSDICCRTWSLKTQIPLGLCLFPSFLAVTRQPSLSALVITIGNIHNNVHCAHRNGLVLLGFLAILASEYIILICLQPVLTNLVYLAGRESSQDPHFHNFRCQLLHSSLAKMLEPLRPGMTKHDGHFQWAVYGIGPYIADYPEQALLACVVQNWCPRYVSGVVCNTPTYLSIQMHCTSQGNWQCRIWLLFLWAHWCVGSRVWIRSSMGWIWIDQEYCSSYLTFSHVCMSSLLLPSRMISTIGLSRSFQRPIHAHCMAPHHVGHF